MAALLAAEAELEARSSDVLEGSLDWAAQSGEREGEDSAAEATAEHLAAEATAGLEAATEAAEVADPDACYQPQWQQSAL